MLGLQLLGDLLGGDGTEELAAGAALGGDLHLAALQLPGKLLCGGLGLCIGLGLGLGPVSYTHLLPDIKGREEILQVHAKNKPLAEDVDLRQIARGTAGFTGADLENLLNEAALLAGRSSESFITVSYTHLFGLAGAFGA